MPPATRFVVIYLFFVISIFVDAFFDDIPRCSTGKRVLIDENLKIYPCQRGCPDKFYCEKNQKSSFCCPNSTLLSSSADAAEISFQLESSAELLRSLSCERFPYRQNCKDIQPITMYFFDVQTLNCEMYPYGICENDPKLTLRTKKECETRCDVETLKKALNLLEDNGLEEDINMDTHQIAIDDEIIESKHARGHPPPPPPTDLIHRENLIEASGSSTAPDSYEDLDENLLLSGRVTVTLEEEVESSGAEEPTTTTTTTTTTSTSKPKPRPTTSNSTVECSASAYRLHCATGARSQFVYRWELLDGICQSFPYGYCWKERNLAHPRTKEECEKYCLKSSKF